MKCSCLCLLLSVFVAMPAAAQKDTTLLDTISRLDAATFAAFNAHNAEELMTFFTKDVEFYQDNDGVKNYEQIFADFKTLFTGNPGIRRELIRESLEVHPIKDYGAIEIGAHRFCHEENGKQECGSFKFAMIWRKTADRWQLARVISYGH